MMGINVTFPYGGPWELHKKEKDEWIRIGIAEYGTDAEWRLRPGEKTGDPNVMDDECKWDTSGKHRHTSIGAPTQGNITPGHYRIVFYGIISDSDNSQNIDWQNSNLFIKDD